MRSKLKNIAIIAAITTLLCVFVTSVQTTHAGIITVTNTADNGAGTLRDALAAASDGDTINFSVTTPATITLTTGQLLVSDSVAIIGPGPGNLAVSGNHASRVFYVAPSNTVSISSLTITNGFTVGANSGGGIYNDHAALTVTNCTLSGNTTDYQGSGIYNDGSHVAGPGSATLQVLKSTFSSNSIAQSGGLGGAIANNGEGASGYTNNVGSATLQIRNSTFSGNSGNSGSGGGGIANYGDGENGNAVLIIVNSTLSGNSGGAGGGIKNEGAFGIAIAEISNCTFSTNSASFGGAIYNDGGQGVGSVVISTSTFSGNSPYGIFNNYEGAVQIGSTILNANGPSGNISNETSASIISLGYNLCSDAGGGFLTNATDQINTDPLLDGHRDNGGLTLTHALLTGSPAINAGDPGFTSPPDYDQRGIGFARVVCGRIDIGAFEAQTLPAVLSSPTYLPGTGYHFSVAGLACLNYIVQGSTNLAASNWVSLATNAPPFTFVDANASDHGQRFYRAVYLP